MCTNPIDTRDAHFVIAATFFFFAARSRYLPANAHKQVGRTHLDTPLCDVGHTPVKVLKNKNKIGNYYKVRSKREL